MVSSIILESERSGSNHSPASYKLCDLVTLSEPHLPICNTGTMIAHMLYVHTLYGGHEEYLAHNKQ